ncbi:SirA family protein [invertebrate metagenome]|uniref:SirA family protein n=1 Tax=invertebrate metagenome TaxID=1711999 RepID=A0A484HC58_9ZZZZ
MLEKPHYYLDITQDLCPMTFIKMKLMIERMQPGQICELHLQGAEPLANVPRSIAALGHKVIELRQECDQPQQSSTTHKFLVIKALGSSCK